MKKLSRVAQAATLAAFASMMTISTSLAESYPEPNLEQNFTPFKVEEHNVNVTESSQYDEYSKIDYPIAGATSALISMQHSAQENVQIEESNIKEVTENLENLVEPETQPIITDVECTKYVTDILNVRQKPSTDSDVLGKLVIGNEVIVTGEIAESDFVRISYKDQDAFIHSDYLSDEKPKVQESISYEWSGAVLNRSDGTVTGPSGKETYYNLDMSGVVRIMRARGFSEADYPYWVRSDGCKMLGPYIMVAADLNIRPRGSIVPCSLGMAIVADTGSFIYSNRYQLDIATTW